jgi:RNA polymerase sigma-70 factor (ECF subfamily)
LAKGTNLMGGTAHAAQIAPETDQRDERLLAARALAGEEEALRLIMADNNRRLYRIARSIVLDSHEAEDVVQEAYLKAFTHLDEFRGEAALATWLARITINEAAARLRMRRRAKLIHVFGAQKSDSDGVFSSQAKDCDDPEKSLAQREILRLVEQATERLPEDFRLVFVLRVIEGLSVAEVAHILELRPETVKTRLHRARRLIRDQLEKDIGPFVMEAFPFGGARCAQSVRAVLARLSSPHKNSGTFSAGPHPMTVTQQS